MLTAMAAHSVPPYRYHLPAVVFVMTTLPPGVGSDRT
jgi:hypothetical protein